MIVRVRAHCHYITAVINDIVDSTFGESERPVSQVGESENHLIGTIRKRTSQCFIVLPVSFHSVAFFLWGEGECAVQARGREGAPTVLSLFTNTAA